MENPKGGCVLAGINAVLGAIDRICPVYHSGPGCCMQTTAADQGQSGLDWRIPYIRIAYNDIHLILP